MSDWGNSGGSDSSERGGGGCRGRGGGDSNGFQRKNNSFEDVEDNGDTPKEKPREVYIPPEPTDNEDEMFANHIQSGINFDQFDKIPVKAMGEEVPESIQSFSASGLRPFLLNNVVKSGYTKPTPIQKYAIPIIMGKRDLMGCAQTGSGKTVSKHFR
jgi:probable ATP-dependent RNA helicase DDX4